MKLSKTGIRDAWDAFLASVRGKAFEKRDFAVLKTMMMLSAVDGTVGEEEVAFLKKTAESCRGCCDASFGKLWDEALHSAGYIHLQANLLDSEALVKVFMDEVGDTLVEELVLDSKGDRDKAFAFFEEMAKSDGVFSDIEKACIAALSDRVGEAHRKAVAERYSRAAMYS